MDSRRRRLIYGFLAVGCLVLAAITFFRSRGSGPVGPVDLPEVLTWKPSPALIETQRVLDQRAREDTVVEPRDESLLKSLSDFNQVEMETGGDTTLATYSKATERYRVVVERYVRDNGMQRYVTLGLLQQDRFMAALHGLRKLAISERMTLSGIAAHHSENRDIFVLRGLGGNFVDWALEQGLLVNDGTLQDGQAFLLGLLYKLRWLTWSKNMDPVDAYLTRFEKRTLLAYRIEVHPKMLIKRRLALIAELKSIEPGYPARVVELLTLIRHGRSDLVAARLPRAFEELSNRSGPDKEQEKMLRQIQHYLQHQAEAAGR